MEKPFVQLTGEDGNIFSIVGRTAMALKEVGLNDQAHEMWKRVKTSDSYEEALSKIMEYVDWD